MAERSEHTHTLVIGGGQAGLAMAYHLQRRDIPYVIVDANERVGDAWRNRWDSLRLFTPNFFNSLPGLDIPGFRWAFPTKDEFADYLESYARHFDIPVETGVRIDRLYREGDRFVAETGDRSIGADNVVVAMSSWQKPEMPDFAGEIDAGIKQVHVADYEGPNQMQDGSALVVGAGNSGAEVARELARSRKVVLSGPDTGGIPFRPESVPARVMMPIVGRVVFHRILKTSTPIGRRARPKMVSSGGPLIRVKKKDLDAAGVERVPRVVGAESGLPVTEDGRTFDVRNVVWATGFRPGFDFVDIPEMGGDEREPGHRRGVVEDVPGLFFLGLRFLYSVSSEQIHGVGRDAAHIAKLIARR